jgi:ligand-binding SRPBCC domain-containing protein
MAIQEEIHPTVSTAANSVDLRPSPRIPGGHELTARLFVEQPIDQVFTFFADAHNLQRITPADLDFSILTPSPIDMHAGTQIDYRLKVRGIPIRWRSLISTWEPPFLFVDEQVRGPYRVWHHVHRFERVGDGTNVIDEVTFKPIGGALMTRLFVGRDVKRIFEYRSTVLQGILGELAES